MTLKNANLDGILSELQARKTAKLAGAQGDRDTTHPIADAPNSTESATTGARASESASDVKDQQEIGVENTGGPVDRENPSGSMGVEDKKSDEGADLDNGDTSGVSEMAEKDTTHPSKNASAMEKAAAALELLTKALEDAGDTDGDGDGEKTAEEKLAEYAKELETDFAEHVDHGKKFAEYALGRLAELQEDHQKTAAAIHENAIVIRHLLKTAASEEELAAMGDEGLDTAAMQLAEQGIAPEELEAELGGAETGLDTGGAEEAELAELAAALEEAGVTPEELEAALAEGELGGELGGEAGLGEEMGLTPEEEEAALGEAMAETGVTPEELAQAEKLSSAKSAAFTNYKQQLVTHLQALKGATK